MVKEGLTVCFPPVANEKEIKLLALGNTLAPNGQNCLRALRGELSWSDVSLSLVPCTKLCNPVCQFIGLSVLQIISTSVYLSISLFVIYELFFLHNYP